MESRHNLRYWKRQPYLGVGLDASSMLRKSNCKVVGPVWRSTTSDDLKAYLDSREPAECAWISHAEQHEEAWFLGLRLNAGVELSTLEHEFGSAMIAPALEIVRRLASDELVDFDGQTIRLTPRGRLLSNDVFQEFLGLAE
jgi:oxygen-independent coproporphyrinogen-3 oxidase